MFDVLFFLFVACSSFKANTFFGRMLLPWEWRDVRWGVKLKDFRVIHMVAAVSEMMQQLRSAVGGMTVCLSLVPCEINNYVVVFVNGRPLCGVVCGVVCSVWCA